MSFKKVNIVLLGVALVFFSSCASTKVLTNYGGDEVQVCSNALEVEKYFMEMQDSIAGLMAHSDGLELYPKNEVNISLVDSLVSSGALLACYKDHKQTFFIGQMANSGFVDGGKTLIKLDSNFRDYPLLCLGPFDSSYELMIQTRDGSKIRHYKSHTSDYLILPLHDFIGEENIDVSLIVGVSQMSTTLALKW